MKCRLWIWYIWNMGLLADDMYSVVNVFSWLCQLFSIFPLLLSVFLSYWLRRRHLGLFFMGAGSRHLSFVFMERGWKCVLFRFLTIWDRRFLCCWLFLFLLWINNFVWTDFSLCYIMFRLCYICTLYGSYIEYYTLYLAPFLRCNISIYHESIYSHYRFYYLFL